MKTCKREFVSIGADPELLLMKHGRVLYARDNVRDTLRAGCDGAGTPAEIRPFAQESVKALLDECWRGLIELRHAIKDPDGVVALARPSVEGNPLGGHIHLGGRGFEDSAVHNGLDRLYMLWGSLVEHNPRWSASGGYGRTGDYRSTGHGIEYRVPPTWLAHPAMAWAYLTIAKIGLTEPANQPAAPNVRSVEKWLEKLQDHADPEIREGSAAAKAVLLHGYSQWDQDVFTSWGINDYPAFKASPIELANEFIRKPHMRRSDKPTDEWRMALFIQIDRGEGWNMPLFDNVHRTAVHARLVALAGDVPWTAPCQFHSAIHEAYPDADVDCLGCSSSGSPKIGIPIAYRSDANIETTIRVVMNALIGLGE